MFLAKDAIERNVWHRAEQKGQLGILYTLLEWAEKVLTPDELNNKRFVAKDI